MPLCYPLLVEGESVREYLIENNIYIPSFWPNYEAREKKMNGIESFLSTHLLPLPIDQRYNQKDMKLILDVLYTKLRFK
mgnify:FL=1